MLLSFGKYLAMVASILGNVSFNAGPKLNQKTGTLVALSWGRLFRAFAMGIRFNFVILRDL